MGINEYIQIGNKLRKARTEKGYTQKQFAELVGIPYSTYSNYENNNREPGRESLERIANALGLSVIELLEFWEVAADTPTDLENLNDDTDSYLKFKLEELRKKKQK